MGQKQISKATFTVAVNRREEVDYINCVAWNTMADTIFKYFSKADPILLEGRIQTGKYVNSDGKNTYTFDVIVENFEFVSKLKKDDPKETTQEQTATETEISEDPFTEFSREIAIDEDSLPF